MNQGRKWCNSGPVRHPILLPSLHLHPPQTLQETQGARERGVTKPWSEPKKLLAIFGGGDQPPPKVSTNFFPNTMMRSDSTMHCSQSSRNLPGQGNDNIHDLYVAPFLLSYLLPVVIYLGVRLVEVEDHVNPFPREGFQRRCAVRIATSSSGKTA